MKKLFSILLTVCLLASLAATALAEEPVTITILHYMGNEVKLNAFNKILDGYKELHPNVTFDSQALSQNEYITQLRTRVGAGDAPDIMMGQPGQYADIIEAGYVMDLTGNELITTLGLTEGDLNNCSYNGRVYALPLDFKTYGIIYNKGLFEKLGLSVPTTQDELDAVCKTLKDNGIDPWARNYSNVTYPDIEMRAILWPMLQENGHNDAFEKLMAGEAKFADYPEFEKALELWGRRMEYSRMDDMSNDTTMGRQLIASEAAAMIYDGTWAFAQIQQFNPEVEYGMFPVPRDDGKENAYCVQLDQIFMVNGKSEHTEAVMDFMKYLLSPDVAGQWSADTLGPSVVPGVSVEMPDVILTAIKAKEAGSIAHEGAFTASFSGEYLTNWRSITQGFCADRSLTPADTIAELQSAFDEINASK